MLNFLYIRSCAQKKVRPKLVLEYVPSTLAASVASSFPGSHVYIHPPPPRPLNSTLIHYLFSLPIHSYANGERESARGQEEPLRCDFRKLACVAVEKEQEALSIRDD